MAQLTISQVARQIRLRPSAIRYYERISLLPPAERVSGQRRYDPTVLYRLAIIQRARQLGFTLREVRHLFFGFRDITRPSERWRTLSQRKLAELDHLMDGIKAVRGVLNKLMTKCRCDTLDQCGKGIFQTMNRDVVARSLPPSRHREKYATSLRTGSGPKSSL
jgi:MerR family redox-sensitive transcriptional activator SoxR